ncbi:thioredoxin family protein [Ascidiimonas sp. W6]|uniref:thioredoxin family protein n=1 Tax=Ascidiimonas meishanensis TaxID=3128903 RepID=UPI0030ECAD9A
MNQALVKALESAKSYMEYRNLVSHHVVLGTSTGFDQSEALSNYTMLNDRRMKRLDKTVKLAPEIQERVKEHSKNVTWLVLTESWCGDAAHTIPIMEKMAALNDQIELKVSLRDENEDLMNQYLTNGNKSIPKLLVIDNASGEVLNTWGPRPSKATAAVEAFKNQFGTLTPEFKQDLQLWYNKDKGQNTAEDLSKLMILE